jgi:predicted GNAT family N-acyltransferase
MKKKPHPFRAADRATRNIAAHSVCVRRIRSIRELQSAFAIRMRVFVKEQRVPAEIELDRDDQRAIHLLATLSGEAVGTVRIVKRGAGTKIGRMAVVKKYRGRGIGKKLVRRAITTAKKQGAQKIYLHAQVPVIGFYISAGFQAVGSVFNEAGIPHRKMILKAAGKRQM